MTSTQHTTSCPDKPAPRRQRRRLGVIAAAVAGVSMVTTGAFASWNATATANTGALNAASGTVAMVDANGGTFASSVTNLLPGDYFYRYVNLTNDGTAAPYAGTLSGTGDLGAQLTGAADACSVPWTAPGGVSTCTGTTTPLLATVPLTSAATVTYGTITTVQYVRYSFTFSASAPQSLQGKTGAIAATVNTTLVGGRNRTSA